MDAKEKNLFLKLCSFKTADYDDIAVLLQKAASPEVLGHLFFNRMQAVAYGTLERNGLLGKVNREFRNSLKGAYEQNVQKNDSFFKAVRYVSEILASQKGQYAMLKGAVLCKKYPKGYRTSNDIDLLVCPERVTQIGKALIKEGFRQGDIRNGTFIPASRKEIIESRMTRGETIPYIKEVNLPGMRYLEVDINFSLDYKNSTTDTLERMLSAREEADFDGFYGQTLCREDFFIHLCGHLYKEATTLPWVEMKRDMTLYKYCDIYLLLHQMTAEDIEKLFQRAFELDLTALCCFAILQTAGLFEKVNPIAVGKARECLTDRDNFLNTVISPKDGKVYQYTERNIADRFFARERLKLLEEV